MIAPNWSLLFSKKRGRWWVRLLAWGRYHHVKALAYLPAMRAWLFYDVKFNGTRLVLAREDDPGTRAFLLDYLDRCDLVAMPRLPMPKRTAPHAGFWCTLAMTHLIGIRTGAWRPDRLWQDAIAAGGKPYDGSSERAGAALTVPTRAQAGDAMLAFLKAHAQTPINASNDQTWWDDALNRQRGELVWRLRVRIRALRHNATTAGRRRSYGATA